MLRIERYNALHKQVWNDFVSVSINGSFLFDRDYMDYHSDRFKDMSLIIFKENEVIAIFPANVSDNKVYSHQGLTYGGLIVSAKINLVSTINMFSEVLKFYSSQGITEIIYKPIPSFYHLKSFYEEEYVLFLTESTLVRRDVSSVIHLVADLKYQERRYRGIKKSLKAGVVVRESATCDEFWDKVLIPNLRERYNLSPVHSVAEMNLLMGRFVNNIKQYNIYIENEIVGGVLLFKNRSCVHSQYIGATGIGKQLNALDLLFDFVIRQSKEEGKEYFSFGISNEKDGLFLNKGLNEWKESFGARSFSNSFYRIETSKYNKLDAVISQ